MSSSLTFGSLFAGIGGLDLGLERAGLVCKWQVENDEYAARVLAKHWPDVKRWDDVRTFLTTDANGDGVRKQPRRRGGASRQSASADVGEAWQVGLIAAGFPCQDVSQAGKGEGLSGRRSGLIFEVFRLVGLLRPKYVLLENVAALATRGLDRILGEMASLGYCSEWHSIPVASFGALHIRDRIFVLSYCDCEGQPVSPINTETQRLSRLADSVRLGRNGGRPECGDSGGAGAPSQPSGPGGNLPDSARRRFPMLRRTRDGGRYTLWESLSPEGQQYAGAWSTKPGVGRVANGVSDRVDRLRTIGNAVAPIVAQFIGERILDDWKETQ